MKIAGYFGVVCAIVLHVAFILFGGLLFASTREDHGTLQEVELLSEDPTVEQIPEDIEHKPEDIEAETEEVPDATEVIRNLELSAAPEPAALDAASLSAIEAALSGQVGSGDFAMGADLTGGGRIGATGKGGLDEQSEDAFSLSEIDQEPRAIFDSQPIFPAEMRGKKTEGVITVIFIVDITGKVSNPRVFKASHPAFEKPTLDAMKKWKFEPGVKGGQRVPCRMRRTIRFPPS